MSTPAEKAEDGQPNCTRQISTGGTVRSKPVCSRHTREQEKNQNRQTKEQRQGCWLWGKKSKEVTPFKQEGVVTCFVLIGETQEQGSKKMVW